jgi:hypothetical protein
LDIVLPKTTSLISFMVPCSLLQYPKDLAVYVPHVDVENVQATVQSACDGLNGFFRDIRLSISESKSEFVLFSRKYTNPSVCVTLNGQCMPVARGDVRRK